ncbi:MAG TPA: helix-turn-helix domain-containing protein [Euzebyales bacterium]
MCARLRSPSICLQAVTTPAGTTRLTPTEWLIVETLVRNESRIVTHRQLLEQIWGPTATYDTNLLRVHLAHIRRKLEPDPRRPRYFHTDAGMGYRFVSGQVDVPMTGLGRDIDLGATSRHRRTVRATVFALPSTRASR